MAKLVIFIPFPRKEGGDLKDIVSELEKTEAPGVPQFFRSNCGVIPIDSIQIVYSDEIAAQVGKGDVLLVNAHGGSSDTKLSVKISPKIWQHVELTDLWNMLDKIGAPNASEVIFYCCFSSMNNHAAPAFRKRSKVPAVFGSPVECSGIGFFKLGRGSAKSTVERAAWVDHEGLEKL